MKKVELHEPTVQDPDVETGSDMEWTLTLDTDTGVFRSVSAEPDVPEETSDFAAIAPDTSDFAIAAAQKPVARGNSDTADNSLPWKPDESGRGIGREVSTDASFPELPVSTEPGAVTQPGISTGASFPQLDLQDELGSKKQTGVLKRASKAPRRKKSVTGATPAVPRAEAQGFVKSPELDELETALKEAAVYQSPTRPVTASEVADVVGNLVKQTPPPIPSDAQTGETEAIGTSDHYDEPTRELVSRPDFMVGSDSGVAAAIDAEIAAANAALDAGSDLVLDTVKDAPTVAMPVSRDADALAPTLLPEPKVQRISSSQAPPPLPADAGVQQSGDWEPVGLTDAKTQILQTDDDPTTILHVDDNKTEILQADDATAILNVEALASADERPATGALPIQIGPELHDAATLAMDADWLDQPLTEVTPAAKKGRSRLPMLLAAAALLGLAGAAALFVLSNNSGPESTIDNTPVLPPLGTPTAEAPEAAGDETLAAAPTEAPATEDGTPSEAPVEEQVEAVPADDPLAAAVAVLAAEPNAVDEAPIPVVGPEGAIDSTATTIAAEPVVEPDPLIAGAEPIAPAAGTEETVAGEAPIEITGGSGDVIPGVDAASAALPAGLEVAAAEPVVEEPVVEAEPIAAEPLVAEPDPIVAEAEPVIAAAAPVVEASPVVEEPVVAEPDPIVEEAEPVVEVAAVEPEPEAPAAPVVEATERATEEATPRRRSRSSRRDRVAAVERRQRRDRGTQSAAAAAWDPARKYPPIAEVIEDTDSGRPGSGSWRAAAAIESLGTYVYKPPI